jgi:hypothetical protein
MNNIALAVLFAAILVAATVAEWVLWSRLTGVPVSEVLFG